MYLFVSLWFSFAFLKWLMLHIFSCVCVYVLCVLLLYPCDGSVKLSIILKSLNCRSLFVYKYTCIYTHMYSGYRIHYIFFVTCMYCIYISFSLWLNYSNSWWCFSWAEKFYVWQILVHYYFFQCFLLIEMVLLTFCPDWPQSVTLLTSVSQVARITGVSHLAQLLFIILRQYLAM
jgi:hypothetical protein